MAIYSQNQQDIARRINVDSAQSNWQDWKWQLKHSVSSIDTFENLLEIRFPEMERKKLEMTLRKFPLSVTPYYLSLIDTEDLNNCPVFRQAFPSPAELEIDKCDMADPLAEDQDSPAPGITHRYPDRVLFHISNVCSMYCRHCTRKRKVGDQDSIPGRQEIEKGLAYIRNQPEVRDVLLSGGDPLMLNTDYLDWILGEIRAIEHVEVIRIGSRMPVVLPYRITDELVDMLKKHQPLWLNTHFNHPREITTSSKTAIRKLADAGIPLGNQTVLLAGVNDCPRVIKALNHKLVANRVRPYYLYQCDLAEGLSHFRTPVGKGIEIMESLIGHTSGFSVPTYVIDAPGGGGKIPLNPNYLISLSTNKVVLRNYEGVITTYQEPDSYKADFCNRNCNECRLHLKLDDAEEYRATGIEMLLSDWNQTISLTPANNERMDRRSHDE
ncbi:L-lysine 2,3-aminomutase [Geoalkalibacter ferrihydriticus]|uniref:L-lysine 2,3-aminomutase n=2 Tax=Geoalkalibacter ferrihydriticus TaxID=392333 RepID=A0A0C2HUB8_9BACT|nr:lysine 2,3-aminomutase [Geoalkalibacter ferrihydriticus]KIH76437.1 lysine 2,3-aminomutase [Geoalkalibacter ferrihydriticus DSM 17813]SDL94808.1 L-lysine 2,3-aminomutase [Geoalkalibacter ferrihydriticus]